MSLVNNSEAAPQPAAVFHLSPLIRLTLLSLYVALTAPLPFLSQVTNAAVPPALLFLGVALGNGATVCCTE